MCAISKDAYHSQCREHPTYLQWIDSLARVSFICRICRFTPQNQLPLSPKNISLPPIFTHNRYLSPVLIRPPNEPRVLLFQIDSTICSNVANHLSDCGSCGGGVWGSVCLVFYKSRHRNVFKHGIFPITTRYQQYQFQFISQPQSRHQSYLAIE